MVSAFAITELVTPSFIISFVLIVIVAFSLITKQRLYISEEFILFFAFLIVCTTSLFVSYTSINISKPVSHYISISFSIVLGYVIYCSLLLTKDKLDFYYKMIILGLLISMIFGFYEFYLKQVMGLRTNILPRPDITNYYPLVFGGVYRIRSFSAESGHYASYVISYFALSLPFVKYNFSKQYKAAYYVIVLLAILLTFSVAAVIFSTFALAMVAIISNIFGKNRDFIKLARIFFLLIIGAVFVEVSYAFLFEKSLAYDLIVNKLNNSNSMSDRTLRIMSSNDLFLDSGFIRLLIGLGPAYFYEYDTSPVVSLYITILYQYGIAGLTLFLLPLLSVLYKIVNTLRKQNITSEQYFSLQCFMFSIIYIAGHFSVISNYWYSWFWVAVSFPLAYLKTIKTSGRI